MPVKEVRPEIKAGGIDVAVVDGVTDQVRYNKAGMAKIETGVAESVPSDGDELQFHINDNPVFKGEVHDVTDNGDGSISLTAYDEVFKTKQQGSVVTVESDYIRDIITRLLDFYDIDHRLNIDDDRKIKTTVEFSRRSPDKILDWLTKWLDILWWVDVETGEIVVGNPPVNEHQLEYVLDSSVEEGSPPFEKVVVYGESPTSRKGRGKEHLISKEKVKGVAGSGEPVHETKHKAVKSQEMADRTAKAILKEFWRQASLGSVTVVGRSDIRIWDRIQMPDHLGGKEYVVAGVKHRLNNKDGWTTEIKVAATVDELTPDVEDGEGGPPTRTTV